MSYWFPSAAVTKYHNPGGLKQQEFILSVLESRSPRGRCEQGHAPSEALGEGPSLPLPALAVVNSP